MSAFAGRGPLVVVCSIGPSLEQNTPQWQIIVHWLCPEAAHLYINNYGLYFKKRPLVWMKAGLFIYLFLKILIWALIKDACMNLFIYFLHGPGFTIISLACIIVPLLNN